jgi:hypothetical protein
MWRLTTAGKVVAAIVAALALAALWYIAGHLWIDAGGICIGSMADCNL